MNKYNNNNNKKQFATKEIKFIIKEIDQSFRIRIVNFFSSLLQ